MTISNDAGRRGRASKGGSEDHYRGPQAVPPLHHEPSPRTRWFLYVFSLIMVLVAGSGFVMKLLEFFDTATREGSDAMASFLIPVLNYLLVAAGFFCLFFWAYLSGQFRDIEAAKYRMLELNALVDAQEAAAHHD